MDASTPDSLHHGAMPAWETYGQQLMLILTLSTEPDSITDILVSARYCLILHFRWKTTGPGRVWFLPSPNVQKDIERLLKKISKGNHIGSKSFNMVNLALHCIPSPSH